MVTPAAALYAALDGLRGRAESACVDGSTYQYTFAASPDATVVSASGTIIGNTVTVAVGTDDVLTAYEAGQKVHGAGLFGARALASHTSHFMLDDETLGAVCIDSDPADAIRLRCFEFTG